MDLPKIIGQNLSRLRLERNLSLGKLSELTGISKVMLSQMEKGEANPSINTIWKTAAGLKVSYTALLEQPAHDGIVVRRADIVPQPLENGTGQLLCYFQSAGKRNFELFSMEIAPNCQYRSPGHGERTEEYVLIESGELTLLAGGETHVLSSGDAVSFPACGEHLYQNTGSVPLRLTLINYYGA